MATEKVRGVVERDECIGTAYGNVASARARSDAEAGRGVCREGVEDVLKSQDSADTMERRAWILMKAKQETEEQRTIDGYSSILTLPSPVVRSNSYPLFVNSI